MSHSQSPTLASVPRLGWFVLGSSAIVALFAILVRTVAFAQAAHIGYFAITFDLCITIPFLYYLFVVRPDHAPVTSVVAVFVVSLFVARVFVPIDHQEFLSQLWLLLLPIETMMAIVIAIKVRAATAATRNEEDIIQRIELATFHILGRESRVTRIAAMEITALYLGLVGWRIDSPPTRGISSSTFHRKAGWGSIVACIVVVLAAEMIAVHLLIQQWSHSAAWIVTAIELWGVLWLIGDYHAFRLRPLVVTGDTVELRFGSRWSATFSRSIVTAIDPLSDAEAERLSQESSYLRLAFLDEPDHVIRLREPVLATGMFGISREVTAIGLTPDDQSVLAALRR